MVYFLIPITTPGKDVPNSRTGSIEEMLVSSNINVPCFPTLSHFTDSKMYDKDICAKNSYGTTKINEKYDS